MVLTAGFAWMMNAFGLFTMHMIGAARPNTAFIWQPDWMSFVVAFLAGIAGTLSLTSAKSGALIGVAISVTTVPAAANAAVAFNYGEYGQTWGSGGQLLANLGGIVLAGTLTLLVQKALLSVRQPSARTEMPGLAAAAETRLGRHRGTPAMTSPPCDRCDLKNPPKPHRKPTQAVDAPSTPAPRRAPWSIAANSTRR